MGSHAREGDDGRGAVTLLWAEYVKRLVIAAAVPATVVGVFGWIARMVLSGLRTHLGVPVPVPSITVLVAVGAGLAGLSVCLIGYVMRPRRRRDGAGARNGPAQIGGRPWDGGGGAAAGGAAGRSDPGQVTR